MFTNQLEENIELQKTFFALLFQIRINMKEVLQEADSGLSPLQVLVLRTLVEEGSMSLIHLAHKIGRDKSQITRLIQELEKKGIVKKERSTIDRRSFILKVNDKVHKDVSFFIQKEQELVEKMLTGISFDDQQRLKKLFTVMLGNLR